MVLIRSRARRGVVGMKRSQIMIGLGLFALGGIWLVGKKQPAPAEPQEQIEQSVLGTTQEQLYFTVNVPARFTQPLTAPNVLYSLTAGSGIRVSEGQSPTLTNTGVLSLQGQTGALTLTAGSGMTLSGLTLTNSDTGSGQNIFKTIAVSGQTSLSTDTNADTLTLAGSGGITLTTDPDSDKITITSAAVDYTLSGFTDSGTSVYLTTTTDNLGVGTLTPTYKLDVAGTGHYSDALTLDSTLGVTGTTTLDGSLLANGNVTFGNATSDTLTFTARLANGTSLLPDTDLGSDLGSSGLRFNNLWVANINSNSSQAFSGQTTFSYAPLDTTIDETSVLINPTTSAANGQLLAFGIAGYQKALIDEDGDIILGYSDATSAPVTDTPLTIYGHSGTLVAYIDTSGNLDLDGVLSINGTTVLSATTLGSGVTSSSLTQTGALNSGSITSGFGSIDTGADTITTTATITAGTLTLDGDTYNQITTTGSENLSLMPGGNVGIGTTTPANTLTVLGDIAASVATNVEGLKLTDTSDVTKMALKWSSAGTTFDSQINLLTNSTFEKDLTGWSGYTLNDEFTTDRVAGAVSGTSAEPTGGTRTVADTTSRLSVGSGSSQFSSGGGPGDPALWYPSIARTAGRVLTLEVTNAGSTYGSQFGFDTAQTGAISSSGITFTGTGVYSIGLIKFIDWPSPTTSVNLATVLRTSGAYYFIKGGAFANWTFLGSDTSDSTATLYPSVQSRDSVTSSYIRIPFSNWLPTPLAYDTFTRADGAIGSSETTGPDSQTTPALEWTGGAISSNTNVITPTLGSDVATDGALENWTTSTNATSWSESISGSSTVNQETSDLHGGSSAARLDVDSSNNSVLLDQNSTATTGVWYTISGWMKSSVNGKTAVFDPDTMKSWTLTTSYAEKISTYRATTTSVRLYFGRSTSTSSSLFLDDVTLKPMTLSELFSTVSTSDKDVISSVDVTMDANTGTQAGLVTNLNSSSSPTAGLVAYYDYRRSRVRLDKFTSATTWTNLIDTSTTYSAGATLRVITYHSDASTLKVRVYYNNALVGSEQTVTDAGIIDNTLHGLFSTYSGNSLDNFTLFARGTGGEYDSVIPAEGLTATRDTGIYYAGSASMKLVAGANDNSYLQSITLPDTSTYNFTAYAYTDGSEVTTADLDLYYDTGELTTTFSAVGGGWYKLTGTLTGVASSKLYGVKVHAGKTVYVDNFGLFASTTTFNSGAAGLQALIVKGFSGQTEDLQEWQDSTGAVLGSLTASGGLSLTGNLDINGTSNDIAGALNLSGNSLTSTGALTITPTAGNNLNISLGTTGDFKVNTNDLVVDTSEGRVGVGTTSPSAKLHVIALTEQERLGYDTSNYWTSTVGVTGALTMQGVGSGGALTLSPTAGQNLNVSLATTGDFIVNTNDLVADTSSGYIGINTTAPTSLLDIGATSKVDGLRLTNSGTKVLGLSYSTNSTTWDATSTDPTNKLTNGTFDTDLTGWNTSEGNWWLVSDISAANAIAVYQPKASASLAASYSNLANPGVYDLTATVPPTWDTTNGWIFSGTQFLKTGLIPSASTWSYLIKFSNGLELDTLAIFGATDNNSQYIHILPALSGTNRVYVNGGTGNRSVAGTVAAGVMGISEKTAYLDGVSDGTIGAGTTIPQYEIYVGGRNKANVFDLGWTGYIQAFAIYDTALSSGQMLGVTNAMNAIGTSSTSSSDTDTKYGGSSSAKIIAVNDTSFLQSANVGDTETYNLIAYAYTDGSAVTTADLELYYDTDVLTTTYTPMGGTGWYKLTGSFTGEASAKNYGVRVKAGKTVYVDEVKLQVGVGSTQTMYVLDSNTGVTGLNVQGLINGTLNGVATYTKAGTISDTDFSGGATDGLLGIDTTNHRIYFRE
ncbi:MAG: hypothetical protein UX59_C0043G0001, partial [Microgenomates group bacterium GW2011_GWA1_46_7]